MSAVAERCAWSDGRLEVAWLDADGARQRAGLVEVATVAFEQAPPVRGFPSFRGQRNFPGLWWLATTGEHVGYESWLERDHLMVLDADPCVVGVSSQPLWLHWTSDGRAVRHVPDFFARLQDGTAVVLDVRADDQIPLQDAAVFATTAQACASVGWTYRRVGGLDPVWAANLRWLAGYRHPRCLQPQRAVELQQVFAQPRSLMDEVLAVGDPIAVLLYDAKRHTHTAQGLAVSTVHGDLLWCDGGWPGSCHEHELLKLAGLERVLDAVEVASLLDRGFRGMAKFREHWHAPVGDRRTKDRLTDQQRAFNRMQAGLRALVEQSIGHLANAWSLRRWRGLLHRVQDVFRAAAALICLCRWLHRIPT